VEAYAKDSRKDRKQQKLIELMGEIVGYLDSSAVDLESLGQLLVRIVAGCSRAGESEENKVLDKLKMLL
jgi:predicted transcriptional regulator